MSDHSTQAVIEQLAGIFDQLDEMAPPIGLDELDGWEDISLDARRRDSLARLYRRRRRLAGIVAALVVVMGGAGLWWLIDPGRSVGTVVPADESNGTNVTPPAETSGTAVTAPPLTADPAAAPTPHDGTSGGATATGDESIAERLSGLDAYEAARQFQPDALGMASPAETADLVVANELRSRACYEELGLDLPPFDPDRLGQWQAHEEDQWDLRRRMWTPDGQQELREQGNTHYRSSSVTDALAEYPHMTAPVPETCYPAATGVTYLGSVWGWSDTQLRSVIENDERWMPLMWGFGRLPGTEAARQAADTCMLDRGWDQWMEPNAYWEFRADPEASATEIELTNDMVDCYNAADAPAIYLAAATQYVEEFSVEFADELAAIAEERAGDLAEAYTVLSAAGLDPLSD